MTFKLFKASIILLFGAMTIQSCTPDANTPPATNNNPSTCPWPYRTGTTLSYTTVSGTTTQTSNWSAVGDTTANGIPMKLVNASATGGGQTVVSRAAYGKVGGNIYSTFFAGGLYTPGARTSLRNTSNLVTIIGKTDQPVGHTWNEEMRLETVTDLSPTPLITLTSVNAITLTLACTVTETNASINVNGTTYNNVTKISANRVQRNEAYTQTSAGPSASTTLTFDGTTDMWFDCSRGLLKSESTTRTTTPGQPANPTNSSFTLASYNY